MKCKRCRATLNPPVNGWANCPKCGLGKFIGIVKSKKGKEGEAVEPAEVSPPLPEDPEPAPEPEDEPEP